MREAHPCKTHRHIRHGAAVFQRRHRTICVVLSQKLVQRSNQPHWIDATTILGELEHEIEVVGARRVITVVPRAIEPCG
jgi:hypothetical protein